MNVSETLLSIVAFRLAVLVLFVMAAQALPARSHHDASVPHSPVVATKTIACVSAAHGSEEDARIQDMLTHN